MWLTEAKGKGGDEKKKRKYNGDWQWLWGRSYLLGTEFLLAKMRGLWVVDDDKSSMIVLNTIIFLKIVEMVSPVLCVFYHN